MPKIKKDELPKKEESEKKIYTKEENLELYTLLKLKYNGACTRADEDRWLADEGALNENGAVILSTYEICRDRLQQMYKWQARREYAKKKSAVDLEKLSEQFDIAETQVEQF